MSGWNRSAIGRRRFVQLMGWAGAAAVAHGGPALAAAAQKSKASARPPQPPPPPPPPPSAAAPSEVSEEARAMAGVVKQRYGQFLTPADLETVTRDLDGDVRGLQRLRAIKLANADEPDITFKA